MFIQLTLNLAFLLWIAFVIRGLFIDPVGTCILAFLPILVHMIALSQE